MIIYLIMLFLSLMFCSFYKRAETKNMKITYVILSFLPFFFVSGLRYDVGTDYLFRYAPDYLIIYEGGNIPNLEIAMKLIMKFCCLLTRDYSIFFILTSFVINSLVFIAIYKYSNNPFLSIIVYFANSSFFLSMNLVRQYISVSFLLIAFLYYIQEDKKVFPIILIIIATLFHTSSIIFLPILFLNKKSNSNILLIILSLLILILGFRIVNPILNFFSSFSDINFSKYSAYVNYGGDMPVSSLVVECLVYIYYALIYNKIKCLQLKDIDIKKANILLNIQWFVVLFVFASSANELFIRMSSIFSIFQIISLPYFYGLSKQYVDDAIFIKKAKSCLAVVLLVMSSRMVFSMVIKGAADIVPYKSIFDRPNNIYSEINYVEYRYNRS